MSRTQLVDQRSRHRPIVGRRNERLLAAAASTSDAAADPIAALDAAYLDVPRQRAQARCLNEKPEPRSSYSCGTLAEAV